MKIDKIKLIPYLEKKPWGGHLLSSFFNCENNTGEAWIVSCINNKQSKLENGMSLDEFINKHKDDLGLKCNETFPILIKIIDACDDLSIQVHPDDEFAKKLGYENGKFECWKVLNKTKANKIIFGLKPIDKKTLKEKVLSGDLSDLLIYKDIQPGDFLKVLPGTVHAILKNTLILEVQDPSDITFRLFDYNRLPKRELHIDNALESIYKDHPLIDDEKFIIDEDDDKFYISIKGYDKFYFEVDKSNYETYLCIKKGA